MWPFMAFWEELRADNDELRRQNAELEAKDQSSVGWEKDRTWNNTKLYKINNLTAFNC